MLVFTVITVNAQTTERKLGTVDVDSMLYAKTIDSINYVMMIDSLNYIMMLDSINYIKLLDSINYVKEVDSINYLEKVDSLIYIEKLDSLDYVMEVDSINYIEKLDSINYIEKLDSLNYVEKLDSINYMEKLDSLIYVAVIDLINTITTVGTVSSVTLVDSIASMVSVNTAPDVIYKVCTERGTGAFTTNVTMTLAGDIPAINYDAQLGYLKVIPASGPGYIFVNGENGVTLRESANVITISGAGTPLTVGDTYELGVNAPKLEIDYTVESIKNTATNPIWSRYTDFAVFQVAAETLTTSWADWGPEQDVIGYNQAMILGTLDINAANNARIRVLYKWESAGTDEFNTYIYTVSASDIKMDTKYFEFNSDIDQNFALELDCKGAKYMQFQVQEGTDGGTDAIIEGNSRIGKKY